MIRSIVVIAGSDNGLNTASQPDPSEGFFKRLLSPMISRQVGKMIQPFEPLHISNILAPFRTSTPHGSTHTLDIVNDDIPASEHSSRNCLREVFTLVMICLMNMTGSTSLSLFPSISVYGVPSSSIVTLTMAIMSLVYGVIIPKVGPLFMFRAGTFILALALVLLAALERYAATKFLPLVVVYQVMIGISISATRTAGITIALGTFKRVAFVLACIESLTFLGLVISPHIHDKHIDVSCGSIWTILGTLLLITFLLSWFMTAMEPTCRSRRCRTTSLSIVAKSSISPCLSLFMSSLTFFTVYKMFPYDALLTATSLEPEHMKYNDLWTFVVVLPFWGLLLDLKNTNISFLVAIFGTVLNIFSCRLLTIDEPIYLYTTSKSLIFAGCAAQLIASFKQIFDNATTLGYPVDLILCGAVSGIWCAGLACGAFIAELLGGLTMNVFVILILALQMTIATLQTTGLIRTCLCKVITKTQDKRTPLITAAFTSPGESNFTRSYKTFHTHEPG